MAKNITLPPLPKRDVAVVGRVRSRKSLLSRLQRTLQVKLALYNRFAPVYQSSLTLKELQDRRNNTLESLGKVCDTELVTTPAIAFSCKIVSADPKPKLLVAAFSYKHPSDTVSILIFPLI